MSSAAVSQTFKRLAIWLTRVPTPFGRRSRRMLPSSSSGAIRRDPRPAAQGSSPTPSLGREISLPIVFPTSNACSRPRASFISAWLSLVPMPTRAASCSWAGGTMKSRVVTMVALS